MKSKEDQLQSECVRWFRYQYPDIVIFAIPNGGKRNVIEASKLKATGVLPGVADLFVMHSNIVFYENTEGYIMYHGLFIELKAGENKQTQAQIEFEAKAKHSSYAYHVCRSIDEFMKVVNEYLE